MHFEVEQKIDAPRDVVERAFLEPGFYEVLAEMEDFKVTGTVDPDRGEDTVHVRYAFTGSVAAPVRAFIDPSKLSWSVHAEVDLSDHSTAFTLVPDQFADRLKLSYAYRFLKKGQTTRQLVTGDLGVRLPIPVGGKAIEKAMAGGICEHLAKEARFIERWALDQR